MPANKTRAEKEREKILQDRCQALLTQMLKDEDNKYCVDCDSKGPRWASWNLGLFLCIRCAGMHRNLGVHISKVKSVNLDTWTPQQVASMQMMGNSRARAVYEANLPEDHRRPQTDNALESFIREKYEKKKYLAREWVPSKPPDLPQGWGELIEEEKQVKNKDYKKLALPPVSRGTSPSNEKKSETKTSSSPAPSSLTVSLPPETTSATSSLDTDLLGLSSVTQTTVATVPAVPTTNTSDLLALDSNFDAFVSAPAVANGTVSSPGVTSTAKADQTNFFSQDLTSTGTTTSSAVDSGKMSTDSIMALFGSGQTQQPFIQPSAPFNNPAQMKQQFTPNMPQGNPLGTQTNQDVLGLYNQQPQPGFPQMGSHVSPLGQTPAMAHNPFLAGVPAQGLPGIQRGSPAFMGTPGLPGGSPAGAQMSPAGPQHPHQNMFQMTNQLGALGLGSSPGVGGTPGAPSGLSASLWQ